MREQAGRLFLRETSMNYTQRRELECLEAAALAQLQLQKLNRLLAEILPRNRFYAAKLGRLELPLRSLDELEQLPLTYKDELVGTSSRHELANNLTYPVEHYTRFHRSSGTQGFPLVVLDTAADWQWWLESWQFVLDAADVGRADRVLAAFSFGPFIGFWSAFEAATARGALVIPGGGLSTEARVELLRAHHATTLFCTPSYALRLAEVAAAGQLDPASLDVRKIVVAGEPGGSVPAVRDRIERAWNARVTDHSGATEVGPWGYSDPQRRGLHILESEFIAEFHSVETGHPAHEGELSELILTSLGRWGSPVIRYRTGDLVRPTWHRSSENRFVLLEGGVLGRVDDMLIIRGVNIFPSSIDQILRGFPEIVEYRMTARREANRDSITVDVEDRLNDPHRIAHELQLRLGLKVPVQAVPLGSLPRFEGKAKRFVDERLP